MRLSWRPQKHDPAAVFYTVLRTNTPNGAVFCAGRLNNASDNCQLAMQALASTRATSFVDHPGPGPWTYRIGVSANWLNDFGLGDVYVVSKPLTVTVR